VLFGVSADMFAQPFEFLWIAEGFTTACKHTITEKYMKVRVKV